MDSRQKPQSSKRKGKKDIHGVITEKLNIDSQVLCGIMNVLETGSDLYKVKGPSRLYQRKYIIDEPSKIIYYLGSEKKYCLKPKNSIRLEEIHEVRRGWTTDRFNELVTNFRRSNLNRLKEKPEENCCFSIIHGRELKTLDLVCPSEIVCNAWVQGLSYMLAKQRGMKRDHANHEWLLKKFIDADRDRSGTLTFEECLNLVTKGLNKEIHRNVAREIFNKCHDRNLKSGEAALDKEQFFKFLEILEDRPELREIFENYSGGLNVWGPTELKTFLNEEEKMNWITCSIAQDLIEEFESAYVCGCREYLSYEAFCKMLESEKMDIFNYDHKGSVYQDMSFPMNNYYIASSHNTYLTGDQLVGNSSVEGYIRALKEGCRCVEIDLWDGPGNEPKVTHGFTLTSEILLKDVLQDAIRPYAFDTSNYPVILSLENHMSVEQQKVAASHFKSILGDLLYLEPVSSKIDFLPSPIHLRNKIILKGKKRMKEADEAEDSSDSDSEQESKDKAIAAEFSDLINICTAVSFRDIQTSLQGRCTEMSSLSESKGTNLLAKSTSEFVQLTERQLLRIYPSGKRQDSSNYNPIPFWNVGCQIVALNYQTDCDNMMINRAKFRDNGQCGFVLKPMCLRREEVSGSVDNLSQIRSKGKELTIKIISGQRLPRWSSNPTDVTDPYVVVSIRGHEGDENTEKTECIKNNGFNPVWNETFRFLVHYWDFAFIHFSIWDKNTLTDVKLGEICIPCTSLLSGYRYVHVLENKHPATIFVHLNLEDL